MKYLGVDFGLRRLGFAVSEGQLSAPLNSVIVKGFKDAVEKVVQLTKMENFNKIIVGLPEGKMGKTVLGFINALKKQGLDVEAGDETLSTKRAQEEMVNMGIPMEKRRMNDSTAAAIILQNWLDNR
ncbi:MAG: Holliday junction resolvase RuvX [Patescibacteria group bacterium]